MNRVYIEPTKFTDLRSGDESFGWRAFDDYSQTYDGSWSKTDMPEDDVAFLKRVLATSEDEALWAMLDFCGENERGVHIGETFIDWSELLPLLESVRAK